MMKRVKGSVVKVSICLTQHDVLVSTAVKPHNRLFKKIQNNMKDRCDIEHGLYTYLVGQIKTFNGPVQAWVSNV